MSKNKVINAVEYFMFAALLGFVIYGMYLGTKGQEVFYTLVQEDGLVENLTALGLFTVSFLSIYRFLKFRKEGNKLAAIFSLLLAVLFFFAAGEEISWGQRIFNIESTEFFLENNKQGETNLHNLIVGGQDLNILIFSRVMFLALITYFYFSRILVWKVKPIRELAQKLMVPLPKLKHIIVMSIVTLMIVSIHLIKESELHELSFAIVFSAIFLNPYQYDKKEV